MPTGKRSIRYAVVGLGHISQVAVLPAFAHARRNCELVAVVSDDRTKRREIAKRYELDHAYAYEDFDDCLQEGLQDVRIVQALYKSAASGRPVALRPFTKRTRPTGRQRITRPGVRKPALVKVQSASED